MHAIFLIAAALTSFDWQVRVPADGMKYALTDKGEIRLDLAGRGEHCGGDGVLRASVPLYAKGVLDFDVKVELPPSAPGMSGFVSLYGISTFWHDYCRDWRVFLPDAVANREPGFTDEPSRHRRIATCEPGRWHHCRIAFDHFADRVEFFLDDMDDPATIVGGRCVWGADEFSGGTLAVGGMGMSPKGVIEFRGFSLREATETAAAAPRTETLVFDGIAAKHFQVPKLLADERPRVYSVATTRSSDFPCNNLAYSSLPGAATLARAKRIVLVDAPAGPGGILPGFVLADIAAAVGEGAELIVIDGPFGVSRGEYRGTPLAGVLPEGAIPETPFAVFDRPEILERKVGKGVVKVLRGLRLVADSAAFAPVFAPWARKLFGSSS